MIFVVAFIRWSMMDSSRSRSAGSWSMETAVEGESVPAANCSAILFRVKFLVVMDFSILIRFLSAGPVPAAVFGALCFKIGARAEFKFSF